MLKQRIAILLSGGVIGEDVAAFVNQVIDMLESDYSGVDRERAAMFTTHLAMALERIKKGEPVEDMEADMWAEVTACPEFSAASELAERMTAICPVVLPDNERQFIVLHICNLLAP